MKLQYSSKHIRKSDLPVITRELKAIQKSEACITPEAVVQRAANQKNPLHRYFTWNDTVAAHEHRLWQARHLILSVKVVPVGDEDAVPVRAIVNLSPEEEDTENFLPSRGYVFTNTLGKRTCYQEQVLAFAMQQLKRWREKFGGFKQFFAVVEQIDKLKP